MDARAGLSQLAGGLIIFAAACSGPPTAPGQPQPPPSVTSGPPTAPAEPQPPQPPLPVVTTFTVTNGWTGEAVAGALVSADGIQAATDSAGQVRLVKTGNCLKIDVTASGFLERRTCSAAAITLWPVADEEEREATRTMAFRNDQTLRGAFSSLTLIEVSLAEDLRNRSDVMQTWTFAANELQRLTLNRISIRFVDPFPAGHSDGGFVIAPAGAPPDCFVSLAPPWPIETGGFCEGWAPEYDYILRINVLPDRLTDGSVALRALLVGGLGMRPHAMPGLMNSTRPDRELSTFERKTFHMIGLRYGRVMWPDLEP
jgi:hypothetical protein